ncbi:Protein N-acetyltransferase, RimJ/RimL family [Nonomuraea solani]|uniref:Protein N-acetyltransferase, RimJ/RimL family n=1 Tax=Nonomuraea solani TaxID=1144553 RepID=A0A1H6ETZ7_9ACTN|nr:GNAT family N-acetyltransferase [Nonomuraea solani]SEH01340.1 Protein N-acetyltransferase, RimJ/RimL family [Nonomuraea solani]
MTNITLRADATPSAPALILRPWNEDDIEPLIEAHRDPVLRRWTNPIETFDDALKWLDVQNQGWATGERMSFAVHEEGRLLANVVLKRTDHPESAEVGYWTAAHARGRGVAPRALEALTVWAFEAHGLARLELLHQVDNLASCRVAEKARYEFLRVLPAQPPYPRDGHLHVRRSA